MNDTQRTAIVGRTGSGKTVAAVWLLSKMNFTRRPWVVYDFKRDSLLAELGDLEGTEHIDTDFVPTKPGIYFVHPQPDDVEPVQSQMWRIWEQENTGVYVDEGYMVCDGRNPNPAFRALLTQGRSKHVPMIILSQRPCWMDRFVFSEADYYFVFSLNHRGDRNKIMEYIPADLNAPLQQYHSYYHDVARAETAILKPVPTSDDILEVFDSRLQKLKHKYRRVMV